MKILFVTGESFPPEPTGGAEITLDQLARALVARGHDCAAVTVSGTRLGRLARKLAPTLERDPGHAYPLVRAAGVTKARVRVAEGLQARPDVVVCSNTRDIAVPRLAAAAARVLVLVQDAQFRGYIDWLPPAAVVAAVSHFLAGELRRRAGVVAHVLYPYVELPAYHAGPRRPDHVTLLSPLRHKGRDLFLAVAALLPRRRFALVDSPYLPAGERLDLLRRLPANVALVPPAADPRALYARTSVLMVPSTDEAFGRVIVEAQVNGIPVVARRTGGIPEALGDAGVLLPPDAPVAAWADAVEAILSDPTRAAALGERARAAATRPELAPATIVDRFLELCVQA